MDRTERDNTMESVRARTGVAAGLNLGLLGLLGVLGVLWLGGCADPLLSPDEPRSQYDRTDMARGRRAPTYVYDQYGDRKPNLRGRLLNAD